MKIEVKTNDKNIGIIECDSIYEAHTWVIWLEAKGYKCDVIINGEIKSLPENIQHPNSY